MECSRTTALLLIQLQPSLLLLLSTVLEFNPGHRLIQHLQQLEILDCGYVLKFDDGGILSTQLNTLIAIFSKTGLTNCRSRPFFYLDELTVLLCCNQNLPGSYLRVSSTACVQLTSVTELVVLVSRWMRQMKVGGCSQPFQSQLRL